MAPLEVGKYYDAFLEYLTAVGSHQAIVKLGVNAEEGVYPVQKVVREHGYEGVALDQEIIDRNNRRWKKLDNLDYWSKRVGYKPIDSKGKEKVMKFMEDADRRRYVRDNVKRARQTGELFSVADIMVKRYSLEKKRQNNHEKAEN